MIKAFVKYLLTFNKTINFIKSALLESGIRHLKNLDLTEEHPKNML